VIGYVFTKLMNELLLSGDFPDTYKVSTVVPIEKINKTIKCEEFRPINMLLIEEKILEHIVKDQLLTFVEENDILCSEQSGFRNSYSCETALNVVINHFKEQLQQKNISVVTFLDLKRAFETIDRKILLRKLEQYGIKGIVLPNDSKQNHEANLTLQQTHQHILDARNIKVQSVKQRIEFNSNI
jgi:hypothetical protein